MLVSRSRAVGMRTGLLIISLAVFSVGRLALAEEQKTDSQISNNLSAAPKNLAELKSMEEKFKAVTAKVLPAVVGVQVGNARGSGVVISEDGYIMTAGHVVIKPYEDVIVTFPDGKTVKGKTLGMFKTADAGLMRITEPAGGKYPFAEKGKSGDLQVGEWCLAMGHPLGYQPGRPPVVRVGRVLQIGDSVMQTDCPMINGDSGGPVFDLDGKVIGINSRIGGPTDQNLHVPVDVFAKNWARLEKGDQWESPAPKRESAEIKTVFKDIVAAMNPCVVRVKCDGRDTVLGTIVGPDGWIITKDSELTGKITCRFRDGRELDAQKKGVDSAYDLAMLKVDADRLPAIGWNNEPLAVGQWVASPGMTDEPVSLGVVGVPRRPIPPMRGVMGIRLSTADGPAVIEEVMALTPAEKAGIKVKDVITEINGVKVAGAKDLQGILGKCRVGETVKIVVKRGEQNLDFTLQLDKMRVPAAAQQQELMNSFGTGISKRSADFPMVSQHDSVLKPSECGGPLVDLSGRCVGLNIAHAGRTETFAIPSDVLKGLMYDLMSGNLDPKLLAEKKAAEEKLLAEKRAAEEKAAAEKKAAEEKLAAEKKAAEEKAAADKKAAEEKLAAEKAAAEKKVADEKAAAEKAAAEKKAADDKLAAEKAATEKKAADEKAAAEKAAADQKAAEDKLAAEKKAADEKAAADKAAAEKAAADQKAAEDKAAADQKAAEEKKNAEDKKPADNPPPASQHLPPPPPAPEDLGPEM